MSLMNKKFAYTLSEVLLTIALLGALATMTLSTVGASVQQRARLAQFRTAYSKMSSALKNITVDEGKIYQCYYAPSGDEIKDFGLNWSDLGDSGNSGCVQLTKAFLRAIGVTRSCEGNAFVGGCLPDNYPQGTGCFNKYGHNSAYVLDNSMLIIIDTDAAGLKLFAIDVNGRKGPNKWGQDIFPFSVKGIEISANKLYPNEICIMPPVASCTYADGAGKTTDRMMKESAGIIIKDKN